MTTYKELKGTNIQAVSSDPTYPVNGQVWYNTTDNVLKGLHYSAGLGNRWNFKYCKICFSVCRYTKH